MEIALTDHYEPHIYHKHDSALSAGVSVPVDEQLSYRSNCRRSVRPTMHWMQNVCPFRRPSEARSSMIFRKIVSSCLTRVIACNGQISVHHH